MTENSDTSTPWAHLLRVDGLSNKHPSPFDIQPGKSVLQAISDDLQLLALRKLRFRGEVRPVGKDGWRVLAKLGATVVQPCVLSLAPVTTRIDQVIERNFVTEQTDYVADSELEIPDDDSAEQLQNVIDIGEIMVESLSLNVPLYPRASGAAADNLIFTEPGKSAMKDEDARPFAGLKSLRSQLGKDDKQ